MSRVFLVEGVRSYEVVIASLSRVVKAQRKKLWLTVSGNEILGCILNVLRQNGPCTPAPLPLNWQASVAGQFDPPDLEAHRSISSFSASFSLTLLPKHTGEFVRKNPALSSNFTSTSKFERIYAPHICIPLRNNQSRFTNKRYGDV